MHISYYATQNSKNPGQWICTDVQVFNVFLLAIGLKALKVGMKSQARTDPYERTDNKACTVVKNSRLVYSNGYSLITQYFSKQWVTVFAHSKLNRSSMSTRQETNNTITQRCELRRSGRTRMQKRPTVSKGASCPDDQRFNQLLSWEWNRMKLTSLPTFRPHCGVATQLENCLKLLLSAFK